MWQDESFKNIQIEKHKGRIVSSETKEKISKTQAGRKNPWTVVYNKTRIPPIGWHHSEESKKKISDGTKGKNNGMYGKLPIFSKYVDFIDKNGRTFKMRSTWEKKYAEYLDSNDIKWEYEIKTFELSIGCCYTPDFLVEGKYYEVKGYMHKHSKEKIECFKKDYPQIELIIANRTYLTNLGISL